MAAETNDGYIRARPQTRRITVRLSDPEYARLREIAEFGWDYPVTLNHAVKRMVRTFHVEDSTKKAVKE